MRFFLKQKTAYEMRISDWSSDVCSSDLARRPRAPASRGAAAASAPRPPARRERRRRSCEVGLDMAADPLAHRRGEIAGQSGQRDCAVVRARGVDAQVRQAEPAFDRPLPPVDMLDAPEGTDRVGAE